MDDLDALETFLKFPRQAAAAAAFTQRMRGWGERGGNTDMARNQAPSRTGLTLPVESQAMRPRAARLKLPSNYGDHFVVGQANQAAPPHLRLDATRDHLDPLAPLAANLLQPAMILSDPTTPLSGKRALFTFQPALDALASYLTRWFGCSDTQEILPPVNCPMNWQMSIMRLSEVVLALQDWDLGLAAAASFKPLPASLAASLATVTADLNALIRGSGPPAHRITADWDTQNVTLDGHPCHIADPIAFKLWAALIDAHNKGASPIPKKKLFQAAGRPDADPRTDRMKKGCALEICRLIQVKDGRGGGVSLNLPPLP
jgi:hypothetical protein